MRIFKSKRNLIIALVVLVALALAYYIYNKNKMPEVKYSEVAVRRGDLILRILATGTVLPENRLELKPPIAGRVEQVLVKEGEKVKRGQILVWMSSTERAALLDAARSQGPEEVKKWEELYRPTAVIAPISGTVITRSVEAGQTFTNADAVLVMSDRLTVKAQVDETDISKIKLKQAGEIVLDAYPEDKIPAVVDQIAFEATTVNNVTTYLVDVLPERTPEFMRAGMTANVSFESLSRTGVLLLPTEAIKYENEGVTVLVRNEKSQPVPRKIVVGVSEGKLTEVISGVVENEVVLIPSMNTTQADKTGGPLSPFGGRKSSSGGRKK